MSQAWNAIRTKFNGTSYSFSCQSKTQKEKFTRETSIYLDAGNRPSPPSPPLPPPSLRKASVYQVAEEGGGGRRERKDFEIGGVIFLLILRG